MSTLTERLRQLPPARRKKVEERAQALIAQEMSLRDLPKARKQTQVRVAESLPSNQENVSRPEQRSDPVLRNERPLLVFISSVTEPLQSARDTAVQTIADLPTTEPWAFEHTPPSSRPPRDLYLRKVAEADLVIWLIGAETTPPVVEEIQTCLAADQPLLAFRFPAATRDDATENLIAQVSDCTKWHDVPDLPALAPQIQAAITDELVRAFRRPAPPLRRQSLLESREHSIATCKQSWITLRVQPHLATQLARDPAIGYTPPPSDVPFRMLLGHLGSGKSLAAARLFQRAIDRALQDPSAPFPIFVNARDLPEDFAAYVAHATAGIVRPFRQDVLVVIDGLDELGVSKANRLLAQLHAYTDAYARCRILATSKPLPGLNIPQDSMYIPPLDAETTQRLITTIAGRSPSVGEIIDLPESIQHVADRPLFAVLIGCYLRRHSDLNLQKPLHLLRYVAQDALRDHGLETDTVNTLLQRLAVTAIASGKRVPMSTLSFRPSDHRLLVDSLLVEEREQELDFALPILREWYAARAIIEETVPLDDILPASDRWTTSFGLVVDSENATMAEALLESLAGSDPALASVVMSDVYGSTPDFGGSRTHPLAPAEAGRRLWRAMDAWNRGLGDLFFAIGPVSPTGQTATLGIRAEPNAIVRSWHAGSRALPNVVELSRSIQDQFRQDWPTVHLESTPLSYGWHWTAAKRGLVASLDEMLEKRRFALPSRDAVAELAWVLGCAVMNRGALSPDAVPLQEVAPLVRMVRRRLTAHVSCVSFGHIDFSIEEFQLTADYLSELEENGERVIVDPWPHCDRIPWEHGQKAYVWNFYSDERLLQRAEAVYSAALRIYQDMVNRWFDHFRDRLPLNCLLPVTLEGILTRSQRSNFEGAPLLHLTTRVRPSSEPSAVALRWVSPDDFERLTDWRRDERNVAEPRPGSDEPLRSITSHSHAAIDGARPATDLAHNWLIDDLRELGWTGLIMMPSR